MRKPDQNVTVFSGRERVSLRWIELPDELAAWADRNQELVERVQTALTDTYGTLTDDQLWEIIAESQSPEWRQARDGLREAQLCVDDLNSPEKASLGLIGHALDSEENNAAHEQLSVSIAHFTIINEGLRQRDDLSRLLSVLLVQKRMLERSAERTEDLQRSTAALDFSEASQKVEVGATRMLRADNFRAAFKKQAAKLIKLPKAASPSSVSVPSLPKT
ncbi:MAG: hypothetical protein HY052_04675 [Proteobacteria bacterium]|nr:hypothetical protein [Pseudomonadota bacterium]